MKLLKGHLFAALLSVFIIGLGQVVKGDADKGLKMMLLIYFTIPAILLVLLYVNGGMFLVVFGFTLIFSMILWLYNILDAYKFSVKR